MKNILYILKKTRFIWVINLLLLFFVSCGKKERVINSTECHPNQAVLTTITNSTGTFGYDENIKLNTISVTSSGMTSVYLLCNPPITLPALNAAVTFSGTVRASSKSGVNGTTYYEITVSDMH